MQVLLMSLVSAATALEDAWGDNHPDQACFAEAKAAMLFVSLCV